GRSRKPLYRLAVPWVRIPPPPPAPMSGSHLASLSGRVCLAGLLVPDAHSGGVPEWTIGHAWRACVPFGYRGFESHPLRHDSSAIPDTNAEGCGVNGAWRQRG